MKRLKPHEIMTLKYVREHRRVCLGDITSEADQLLADTMAALAKRKLLTVDVFDDGPGYTLSLAGIQIVENWIDSD